jgi:hypothetical protein
MNDAVYREWAPRAQLRHAVHCIWTFEAPADDTPQPIAPDGRAELILQCGAPYREGDGVIQPHVLFAGQVTRPLTLVATGPVAVVGVRLKPEATRAFAGISADFTTDRRVALSELHGVDLAIADDLSLVADQAQDYVEARLGGIRLDATVCAAVEAGLACQNVGPPPSLSERQWQRRFKAEVGVSPRQFQSIVRFRRVFDLIDAPEQPGWVEAALKAGYFDQPQMARDFQRFLGVSARQWATQRVGLATALAAMSETYKTRA